MEIIGKRQIRFTERAKDRAAILCAFSAFEEMHAEGLISDDELNKIKRRYIDHTEDAPCQEK